MGVKKLRLKTAGPCFGDHIIPYHKAKMLYLSNLEKNFFRIAGALKLHFFGFSVLTFSILCSCGDIFDQNVERNKKGHIQGRINRRMPVLNPTMQQVIVNLHTKY